MKLRLFICITLLLSIAIVGLWVTYEHIEFSNNYFTSTIIKKYWMWGGAPFYYFRMEDGRQIDVSINVYDKYDVGDTYTYNIVTWGWK